MSEFSSSSRSDSRLRSVIPRSNGNTARSKAAECGSSPSRSAQVHLIGESDAMVRVYEQTKLAAVTDATVVISGETGTGKELVALAIHQFSRRSTGPLVDVNI